MILPDYPTEWDATEVVAESRVSVLLRPVRTCVHKAEAGAGRRPVRMPARGDLVVDQVHVLDLDTERTLQAVREPGGSSSDDGRGLG
ncbi:MULTISPECIES: hypothetical protein [Streptomyces]|uniref:hypothetical protein n=1 Tax=Streptomyces TaxID=1883 RepID=UPI001CCFAFF1|nr:MULTISPECIES: hypothetical protein [Streptomyces]MBZ6140615.1 hypothetical protein [Streptomyces olivaceus]MBZ6168377.1 hypothetical protein [Streptomyces olivaceus]MCM8555068.1 hypothetical protein [Streptomyces sp. STCH 565 A]